MREILYNACLDSLLHVGYTPEDTNITVEQTAYGKLGFFKINLFKQLNITYFSNNYCELQ